MDVYLLAQLHCYRISHCLIIHISVLRLALNITLSIGLIIFVYLHVNTKIKCGVNPMKMLYIAQCFTIYLLQIRKNIVVLVLVMHILHIDN